MTRIKVMTTQTNQTNLIASVALVLRKFPVMMKECSVKSVALGFIASVNIFRALCMMLLASLVMISIGSAVVVRTVQETPINHFKFTK